MYLWIWMHFKFWDNSPHLPLSCMFWFSWFHFPSRRTKIPGRTQRPRTSPKPTPTRQRRPRGCRPTAAPTPPSAKSTPVWWRRSENSGSPEKSRTGHSSWRHVLNESWFYFSLLHVTYMAYRLSILAIRLRFCLANKWICIYNTESLNQTKGDDWQLRLSWLVICKSATMCFFCFNTTYLSLDVGQWDIYSKGTAQIT